MNNLLYFLEKCRPWLFMVFYITVSCILLFSGNPFHQSVYITSANMVSSSVYKTASGVTSYFGLREINEDLQRRNSRLELEMLALKEQIRHLKDLEFAEANPVDSSLSRYHFIIGHVINNSIHRPHNYITIDKGSADGVFPDMGVVDQNGVIGKVNVVAKHSSRVISLLNRDFRLSCKIVPSNQIGSLVWDGKDYRYAILEEIPRHATYSVGDTVVTSGFSTSFPEGIPIGVVTEELRDYDDNFITLRIDLFTNFSTLGTIRVISDDMTNELKQLQDSTSSKKQSR